MRLIKKIKKGTAVILSTALMAGLVPFMPHGVSRCRRQQEARSRA